MKEIRTMSAKDALIYLIIATYNYDLNKEELMKNYKQGTSLVKVIASQLCGIANEQIAIDFMNGKNNNFLENISYNSLEASGTLAIKAIQLHLINK